MFCINCGNKLEDDYIFCTKCGFQVSEFKTENVQKMHNIQNVQNKEYNSDDIVKNILQTETQSFSNDYQSELERNDNLNIEIKATKNELNNESTSVLLGNGKVNDEEKNTQVKDEATYEGRKIVAKTQLSSKKTLKIRKSQKIILLIVPALFVVFVTFFSIISLARKIDKSVSSNTSIDPKEVLNLDILKSDSDSISEYFNIILDRYYNLTYNEYNQLWNNKWNYIQYDNKLLVLNTNYSSNYLENSYMSVLPEHYVTLFQNYDLICEREDNEGYRFFIVNRNKKSYKLIHLIKK